MLWCAAPFELIFNATTKPYAEKLMNRIPNYGTATKDNDKFVKFLMKHHDTSTYAFYKNNFPTLQKPTTSNSTPSSTTR